MTQTITEPATDQLHDYPMARTCPYQPPAEYAELSKDGALSRVRLYDGRLAWLVTHYTQIREMLADDKHFSSDRDQPTFPMLAERERNFPEITRALLGLDGEPHKERRRMLLPWFTSRQTEKLRPAIQRMTDDLIDQMLAKGGPVDLISELGRALPATVICHILGISYDEHDLFEKHAQVIMTAPDLDQAIEACRALLDYLDGVVEAKKDDLSEDILSTLIKDRLYTGELTLRDVSLLMVSLIIAGEEAATSMIGLGVFTLLEHPEQLAMLREDPSLLPGAVEELVRYLSIADLTTPRIATTDVEVAGQVVKQGEGVLLSTAAANRDPVAFPAPDTFDIRRSTKGHLGWGHGAHRCMGETLARAELEIVFGTLLRRIPTLRLAVPVEEVPMKVGMTLEGLHALPVTW
ncbi:cytochrome P450 [Streptomyces boluensis]|uniref:Cytochrome P450 n=1 Tax=Streptomyces boluensis TaxID=1775135 RepID=A0A964UP01_9ACTN|nr:cytochrome P450 [Streptomyces boluensis]NBE52669.1 cytochrome P450 [Streptomyces boluensis]